jgi:hypothetical protein
MFAFAVISIEVVQTDLPVWGFVFAILIGELYLSACRRSVGLIFVAFIYVIPVGMIQAITNLQVGLKCVSRSTFVKQSQRISTFFIRSVITELIIGYVLPGKPIAMMLFKTWGYITMAQALTFASDFKLGQ